MQNCAAVTRGLVAVVVTLALGQAAESRAGLLLTEIHYNGPASGTDPDEFVELFNAGDSRLSLDGLRFSAGIDFAFAAGSTLEAGQGLVLAREPAQFSTLFTDYAGTLLDFSGALSNAGETLTLSDGSTDLWSVTYDDGGLWPVGADGGGSSLQLIPGSADLGLASSWEAAAPNPGRWAGLPPTPDAAVPQPASVLLMLLGLPLLVWRRRTRRADPPVTAFRQLAACASAHGAAACRARWPGSWGRSTAG